ncbi:phospholipase A1 [Marchantia polymorpha subsp. ruderalis]
MASASSALVHMTGMAHAPPPRSGPRRTSELGASTSLMGAALQSRSSSRRRLRTSIRSEDINTDTLIRQKPAVALWKHRLSGKALKLLRQPAELEDLRYEDEPAAAGGRALEEPLLHPFDDIAIGARWREVQGCDDWAGLLDPIDPAVRGEAIRYGEFAQAAYDAFDSSSHSKYCGSCKYSRRNLLEKTRLANRGYEVTHYIHSTATERLLKLYRRPLVEDGERWSKDSNWIGFVAVSTSPREIARLGRRDIVVVWRGTVTGTEWMEHYQNAVVPKGLDPDGSESDPASQVRVEDTFVEMYATKNGRSRYNRTSAREQVTAAVRELVARYAHEPEELSITVTGHSQGGALATLNAYDLAASGINRRDSSRQDLVPITVYSFASPRVGNNAFRDRVTELGVKVLRVANVNDLVPYVPGVIFNEQLEFLHPRHFAPGASMWLDLVHDFLDLLPMVYTHVGVDLLLDDGASPFLKKGPLDRLNVHNLEVYLHLLDGFVASGAPFTPSGRRDKALVNKSSSFLDPRYNIPAFWWQEKNKGLVKTAEGRWVCPERELEDIPRAMGT